MVRHILYFLAPLFLLFILICLGLFSMHEEERKERLSIEAEQLAESTLSEMNHILQPLIGSGIYLSNSESFRQLVVYGGDSTEVLSDLLLMARTHPLFEQVRLLDTTGLERLRVNYYGDDYEIIASEDLQDKSARRYFRMGEKLREGEVYISPINLNVERGEVQIPYNPVMRIVTPVDYLNKRQGYVVLNVTIERLMNIIHSPGSGQRFFLINHDGEGFEMNNKGNIYFFRDAANVAFKEQFPELWLETLKQESGSVIIGDGVYGFASASPDYRHHHRTQQADIVNPKSARFIVMSYLPLASEGYFFSLKALDQWLLGGLFISLLVLAIILGYNRFHREKNHQLILELNDELIKSQSHLNRDRENLRVMVSDLSKRNIQLKEFSQIISHNLRSPLSSLALISQYLMDEGEKMESSERKEVYDKLKGSSDSLNSLADDLSKAVSVFEDGEIGREKLNICELLEEVKELVSTELVQYDVDFRQSFDGWTMVVYNRQYMESILYNLITNAIRYRDQSRRLRIEVATKLVDGQQIMTVEDNGRGINLDWHGDNIFGLHKTFHEDVAGKGMGLFMAKTQIESQGGKISVESKEGEGSRFTIVF